MQPIWVVYIHWDDPICRPASGPPRLGTNLCRFRQLTLRDKHAQAITGTGAHVQIPVGNDPPLFSQARAGPENLPGWMEWLGPTGHLVWVFLRVFSG